MPDSVAWIASFLLALTFAWAGIAKLLRFERWRRALHGYSLPTRFVSVAVPFAELTVVGVILAAPLRIGGAVSVALLAGFSLAVLGARRAQGDRVPCGCFGGQGSRDYRALLARNGVLAILAALALASDTEGGLVASADAPDGADLVPLALIALGLTLAAWLIATARASFKARTHS